MEPLTEYLDARTMRRDDFATHHEYPFLILEVPREALEKSGGFATQAASGVSTRAHLNRLEQLAREGKELRSGAEHCLVFKVTKRSASVFSQIISIGRTAQSDICIPDSRISKLHAYFKRDDAQFLLHDVGSRNGTRVNGEDLVVKEAKPVAYGDTVELGRIAFSFLSAAQLHEYVVASIRNVGAPRNDADQNKGTVLP